MQSRTVRAFVGVCVLAFSTLAVAQGTRTWEQSKFEELEKGTAKGIAICSAGGLELAPAFKSIATTPSTYIWSIAADRDGNIYAATGSPARIYRISPDGKTSVIFEPQELQVQALVMDKAGAIYAATNPDGKIYKLVHGGTSKKSEKATATDSDWSSSVYFDPDSKYIWDLELDDAGNVYAATGDQGQILRITPKGEHSVFFKSEEAHIRVLAFDSKGNLIAGSDGSGLIYRIAPNGDAFVLYSAPKKEITALAIDKDGNIYAAGAGEKHSSSSTSITLPISGASTSSSSSGSSGGSSSSGPSTPVTVSVAPGPGAAGGSEIYRIAPDGSPARVWSSREDLVYSLAFDDRGRLIAGTGNRGHVFAVGPGEQFTDLLTATASQVTAFTRAPGGGLYAATSNLGKIFLLGGNTPSEGTYESDVFDAHIFSRWGRAEFRGAGSIELFARSGNVDNPDRNWSGWKKVDLEKDGSVEVPSARFVQWKAVLHAGERLPRVESVTLNYLPKNVAPEFDDVSVQLGVRYQATPKGAGTDSGQHFDTPPPSNRDRESVGVRWTVHDDNDDQMVYSVYYRGDGDSRWLLLKDNLTDRFYSFDASLLPDGGYTIKVVASDAPSHSPGQELTATKESAHFEIDTTAPRIDGLTASANGDQVHINFKAADSYSAIKRAEYSIDAGDWRFVEPVGQISDSKTESYDFQAAIPADPPAPGAPVIEKSAGVEHVVVVRVYDRFDNLSSARYVIRGR